MNNIQNGDRILFQGDSITDCGRRETADGLGEGYVSVVAGLIPLLQPDLNITILNRGVGGDRSAELLARWEEDCIDLRPTVLSIMVGVNDVWRIAGEWNGQKYIGPDEYRTNCTALIDQALEGGVRQLILCSPTTIENATNERMATLLAERGQIVRELAAKYRAIYVPTAELQLDLLHRRPDIMWTYDGCHPTMAGHAAMAHCWLKAVSLL